jgi:hypothetical protein
METIKLSATLVNTLLQYLGGRPYVEVANLISAIQQEVSKKEEIPNE